MAIKIYCTHRQLVTLIKRELDNAKVEDIVAFAELLNYSIEECEQRDGAEPRWQIEVSPTRK